MNTAQIEQLKEIGSQLHQTREQQARPLEDIAAKTYIPLRLLRAIEEGQEKPLPEPVFIQGFIRRYAEALGLDGKALAQGFSIHAPAPSDLPQEVAVSSSSAPARRAEPRLEKISRPEIREERRPDNPPQPFPIYIVPIAIAILLLGGLIYALSRPNNEPADTPAASPTVSNQAAGNTDPAPASSPVASPSPAASPLVSPSPVSNAPVTVSLNLTGDSWLQITADGETQYEGILPQGTQRSWSADSSIIVVAGNAGAVLLSTNQGEAQPMGALGAVERVTVTANTPLAPAAQ
ncbi:helix-turn-helix domain-containing protein [Oculatella sp. LEGE 06141]|uniref:helix-turn-helix domain-containing protein n=1 Tax=Oculatella sp. LEGE 06141 TaxID=1828648 RepID=UPI001D1572E4|nr:RodZ domain-containing protein [Oculatella sp. LEGE 06141]